MKAGSDRKGRTKNGGASEKGASRLRPLVASAVAVTLSVPQTAAWGHAALPDAVAELVRFDGYPVSEVVEKLLEDKTTGRKSVKEIGRQLYRKYGLTKEEIAFIEEKVKEME